MKRGYWAPWAERGAASWWARRPGELGGAVSPGNGRGVEWNSMEDEESGENKTGWSPTEPGGNGMRFGNFETKVRFFLFHSKNRTGCGSAPDRKPLNSLIPAPPQHLLRGTSSQRGNNPAPCGCLVFPFLPLSWAAGVGVEGRGGMVRGAGPARTAWARPWHPGQEEPPHPPPPRARPGLASQPRGLPLGCATSWLGDQEDTRLHRAFLPCQGAAAE